MGMRRRAALWAAPWAMSLGLMGAAPPPLRINDVQVIGSHNSFKARIPAPVMMRIAQADAKAAAALDYYHPSLTRQLDLGVRQLEIDVFADPAGGRYAAPAGEALMAAAGLASGFDAPAMRAAGFKVLHVPDIDYLSGCVTLVRCLREIDAWSRAHPGHLPLMITINAADHFDGANITPPLPLTAPLLDALDGEIRSVLPPARLITPDAVRKLSATLREAVLADRWPLLAAARGKLYLVLDASTQAAALYRRGHPSLRGRVMFAPYDERSPEAAVMIVQDPSVDGARIAGWVRQGYIIRTRTDANTVEARAHATAKRDAAFASGAQSASTDYYPGAPDPLNLGFTISLPGGAMARCNPVRRPGICHVADLAGPAPRQ